MTFPLRLTSVCVLLCAALSSCAARDAEPSDPVRRGPAKTPPAVAKPPADALAAARLASVPAGTFGPYLGVSSTSAVAVWIALDAERKRSFFSVPIGAPGAAAAEPARIAEVHGDVGLVAVRPGGGRGARELSAPGFYVVSTHRTSGAESIEALALGSRGELRGGPTSIAQPQGEVLWVETVPTERGAVVLWAVRKDDRADLFAAALSPAGAKLAAAEPVVRGARAWQAAAVDGKVALAVVRPGEARGAAGPVELVFVSSEARAQAPAVVVSASPTAELDLDMIAVRDRLLLAWSDHRRFEPELHLAAVDARGSVVVPPAPATPPFGEQALVKLVPPLDANGQAYLAWENLMQRPRSGRLVELAPIEHDARLRDARARLQFVSEDGSVPELVASPRGLAALTLAPQCEQRKDCKDRPIVPTYVELSKDLDVVASEPVRLSPLGGETAPLAWGLGCQAQGCVSLSALNTTPAPVFATRLEAKSKRWQPAAERTRQLPPPRAVSIEALAAPEPLSEVAAARVGASTLVAYVTYFDPTAPATPLKKPAPDGRFEALRALLEVRSLSEAGQQRPPNVVSLRARSIAGVALAPGAPEHREALLVWGALEKAQPQIFATLLGEDGKKIRQRMLTRTPGEVSEVSAIWAGDGYVVAWVDERHGDPELYVTKLDRALRQVGPERRITNSPGSATGAALALRGKELLLAWADAREGEQPGWADIWAIRLRATDASPLGEEQRLARTRPHSHSPALSPFGNTIVAAWLEEQPESALQTSSAVLRVGRLDLDGRFLEAPDTVQSAGGSPTSLGIDCSEAACNIVMSVDVSGRSELQALRWAPEQPPRPVPLAALTGPHGQAVSPVVLGRQLFYADQAPAQRGRVRRLVIEWQ